jgi:hypothetical protein
VVGRETFTCAACGGTFPNAWTDAEAQAEAEELFGDDLGEDPAVVCDECYQMMTTEVSIAAWRKGLHAGDKESGPSPG